MENRHTSDGYLVAQAFNELSVFHELLEDVFEVHFARFGLSEPKFKALIQLYMTGNHGLSQSDLSKKLSVSRANITGLLERLEKDDLVVRKEDPSDKRVFRVYLTNKGSALIDAFIPIHNEYMHKVMSVLDKSEKETLILLLRKLHEGLEKI